MTTASQVLTVARNQLGYQEGYNDFTKYGSWYGMNNVAWCDIFVSWVGNAAHGNTGLLGKFAYTPAHADWFKSIGRWSTTPKVGSVVFFQWAGWSRICHVGIVEAVQSGTIVTIEGNTNLAGDRLGAGVFRQNRNSRLRSAGGYVVGYGHPAYSSVAAPPPPPPAPTTTVWGGGLCYLSKMKYGVTDSDSVRNLQHRLIALGYSIPAGVTGNYASQTDAAVRQHQAAACPPADPVGASYVGPKQASILFGYPGSPYRVV